MERDAHEISRQSVQLASGKYILLGIPLIAAENGKVMGFEAGRYFLPSEQLMIRESSWEFGGEPQHAKQGENWLKFRVENRQRKKRGRVSELWIDLPTMCVTKIEAQRKFLGCIRYKRIFSAEDIFEVVPGKKLIVVEEENRAFRKESAPLSAISPLTALGAPKVQS